MFSAVGCTVACSRSPLFPLPAERNTHRIPDHFRMSQEKPRKRDRLRGLFCFKRLGRRTASPHSRATSGSPTHISRQDLPSTSVLGGAVASSTRAPLPSTQLFTPPKEPSVETEIGGTDTTLNSSPTQRQLPQQPKHRLRPRNDQAATASHNVTSSENIEKFQIFQDGAKHIEIINSALHGGQTINYGAYVSLHCPGRRDDISMGRVS